MDTTTQWTIIATIIGIVTFLAGREFEKRKLAQQNRLKLLEPVEEWIEKASRLIGIVGDELSAVSQGLQTPVMYGAEDRIETGKYLNETKEKVLGILESKALQTIGTRKEAKHLTQLVLNLHVLIESEYLQVYYRFLDSLNKKQDPTPHMMALLTVTQVAKAMIQDVYGCISTLKTRFN